MEQEERIDDLEYEGLKILQNKNGFCFGIDAVLLSDFAKEIKKGSKVLDLGTGTGIIGLLLCKKTQLKKIVGIELQKEVAEMAKRSIKMNHLEGTYQIINENIKNIPNILKQGTYDAVVTNPPYKKQKTGLLNEQKTKQIARHEIEANFEDFIRVSFQMLKDKGNLYLIHRPERLVEIITTLKQYKMEPKKMRLVQPNKEKAPNLVLIKATKNAGEFLQVEKTLQVYRENGEYEEEILRIYDKGGKK